MSDTFDVVVIGAGVNGLTAAAYLATAGKRVLVVEASDQLGGLCQRADFGEGCLGPYVAQTLYALDSQVLKDFKAVRKGLLFAARDLPLVGLGEGGASVVLSRDVNASARNIAVHSQADAEAWPRFHAELFGLARKMRKLWWKGDAFDTAKLSRSHQALLASLQATSASAWLDGWFESDLLKATLAFDASASSLLEPGSALALVWRAAQEVCGLQGAVAVPRRSTGALTRLLADAATEAGAVIRQSARVERLLIDQDGVAGVELGFRETISCRSVLSALSPRNTLLGLASEAIPFAQARVLDHAAPATGSALVALTLSEPPKFGDAPMTARFVMADRLESFVAADAASRAQRLPDELVFETIVSSLLDTTVAPPGRHVVTCLVRPVPALPHEGWGVLKPKFTAKIVAALDRLSPGLVPTIVNVDAMTPDEVHDQNEAAGAERMLAPWGARIRTPIAGLLLCGASADPVAAVSGRAGRIAAAMALEQP